MSAVARLESGLYILSLDAWNGQGTDEQDISKATGGQGPVGFFEDRCELNHVSAGTMNSAEHCASMASHTAQILISQRISTLPNRVHKPRAERDRRGTLRNTTATGPSSRDLN